MSGFNQKAHINRTPEEIFSFITDPGNAAKVMESVVSSVALTEGPTRVGSRFRETRLTNGREQSAEMEVVAYEPRRRYAVQNVTQGITSTYTYTFSVVNGGTDLALDCSVTASGMPPTVEQMTGRPAAIASRRLIGSPSACEGSTKMSASASCFSFSSASIQPGVCTQAPNPSFSANSRTSAISPSPAANSSNLRLCFDIALNADRRS